MVRSRVALVALARCGPGSSACVLCAFIALSRGDMPVRGVHSPVSVSLD